MKKAGYILLTLLEVLLIAACFVVSWFARKKMGMARYLVYKNRGWEQDYPMELLKNIVLIGIVVLTAAVVLLYIKRRVRTTKMTSVMTAGTILAAAVYTVFTVMRSTEVMRTYYFISLFLAVIALLQIMKAAAAILMTPVRRSVNDEKRKKP